MHNEQLLKLNEDPLRLEFRRKTLVIEKAYFINQKARVLLPSPVSPYLGVITAPGEWDSFVSLTISGYHRLINAWKKQYAPI